MEKLSTYVSIIKNLIEWVVNGHHKFGNLEKDIISKMDMIIAIITTLENGMKMW